MSYKQIKWLILITPTLVIGLWEYMRHEFLLHYISMELGNWLSPIIIFLVTITLLRRLFLRYEQMQEQLKKERAEKAVLQERERIARELHDGIAQTLFLCSVQLNRMKEKCPSSDWAELNFSLRQIHDYVRHSIFHLKNPPSPDSILWKKRVEELIQQIELDTGLHIYLQLLIDESELNAKERVELLACIQEALTNIRKHAQAGQVWIRLKSKGNGWQLEIEDDGIGFRQDPFQQPDRFGLRIMRDRVTEIGAHLSFTRQYNRTKLMIVKEGKA